MAESTSNSAPVRVPQNNNRGPRRRGGHGPDGQRGGSSGHRGGARGGAQRGRGRGSSTQSQARGGRNRAQNEQENIRDGDGGLQPPDNPPPRGVGTSGDRLAGDAVRTEGDNDELRGKNAVKDDNANGDTETDADDGEVCFICASRVEHTSVSPCNHRTCHICALRLRALYKTKACAHCRVSI